MKDKIDLLLINPGGRRATYQKLGEELSAIEPPMWAGLLATNARNAGYSVKIIDAEAEGYSPEEVAELISQIHPLLTTTVVFGANPSASTQKMISAGAICSAIRDKSPETKQMLAGLHVSALPKRTMEEEDVDFVCQGEGPFTIKPLLKKLKENSSDLADVPGLWWRKNGEIISNAPADLIEDLDAELPSVAWDLLPMDKYRAHNWQCFDHIDSRSPYAVIYTSLGCPFNCHFCCINALFAKRGIRYRSIESVIAEIDLLVKEHGCRTFKIIDELFVLKPDRIEQFCDLLIERDYDLNIWAYARVDTVSPKVLKKLRAAGVRWLAYGFESASSKVRDGMGKGFAPDAMTNAIKWTRDAGINIIANYMFGLPDDDMDTMRQTLDEAKSYNFEFFNGYCTMAYPGSKLYDDALRLGWRLPDDWGGYSQLGADTLPLATKHLSAGQVLKFRDDAFVEYFDRPEYLNMIREKFGKEAESHIVKMLSNKIVRKHA